MTIHADSLSARDLDRLCRLVYAQSGITLSEEKRVMLEGRLRRRITALQLSSYREYCEYLFDGRGHDEVEIVHLIDAVTTNKTDFFREKAHFDFLASRVLPEFSAQNNGQEMLLWSAGCSTGEEPYTLAMVLSEYRLRNPAFRFRVLASDISTDVLAKAEKGIFPVDVVRPVPEELRRRYFMRSRNPESKLMRIVPELRHTIEFRRLNLMEEFGLSQRVHAIFCRNVIIYFDRPTQERLFQKFARQLIDSGYMFVGHSESLQHMDVPLVAVAPAVYRKAHGSR